MSLFYRTARGYLRQVTTLFDARMRHLNECAVGRTILHFHELLRKLHSLRPPFWLAIGKVSVSIENARAHSPETGSFQFFQMLASPNGAPFFMAIAYGCFALCPLMASTRSSTR